MKFIVDAQLPRGLCRWLAERRHRAVHVNDLPQQPAPDAVIAAYAEAEAAILVSKDEIFVDLRLPDRFVFIWLRCGNTSNRGLNDWPCRLRGADIRLGRCIRPRATMG